MPPRPYLSTLERSKILSEGAKRLMEREGLVKCESQCCDPFICIQNSVYNAFLKPTYVCEHAPFY